MNAAKPIEETAEVQLIEESRESDRGPREDVFEAIGDIGPGATRSETAPTNTTPVHGS